MKKYNISFEQEMFKQWQEEQLYAFNTAANKPLFIIDTPPPYTNASWHIGGAIHYAQIDMIARIMRMKGYLVHFPMGLDRNGIPIEVEAEKKFKVRMHKVDREEFLGMCRQLLDEVGDQILGICHTLGLSNNSFEWLKVYRTDDPQYRALTQSTFIDLWQKELIYEDERPNNWDTVLQTTVADAEIEYIDTEHPLYSIQFSIKGSDELYAFATTRPELIPSIRTIIYHPDDSRYQHLVGKIATIPLWDIEVEIQPHPMADMEFGTGLVQICSYGDLTDVRILRELGIDPIYSIDRYGKLTEQTGEFAGMKVKEGRAAIVKRLRQLGAIIGEKVVEYRQPISDRSKAAIEFIGMPEYYLKQEIFVDQLRAYANSMQFHPEMQRRIWLDWLDRVSIDWPISRRRYYGTEVPIWYCNRCQHAMAPPPGPYYQPWKDAPPFDHCEQCGHDSFTGDTRTFDTWMDSSISSLYVTTYPNNDTTLDLTEKLQDRPYLADIRAQGKDIVRTWLHYSMLRIHQLQGRPAFQHAWISGHVVTDSGTKMSKRLGNNIDPQLMLDRYGADALRLYSVLEAGIGSDMRFSERRLKGSSKLLNKLYNIARFISMFPDPQTIPTSTADLWIIEELAKVQQVVDAGYAEFDPHPAAMALRAFMMDIFAAHYIELVKSRAYNWEHEFSDEDSLSARSTLHFILQSFLQLLAPIAPHITDYLFRQLYGHSVHVTRFSEITGEASGIDTQELIAFNSDIWKQKKEQGLTLRDALAWQIPTSLLQLADDLYAMHHLEVAVNSLK